MTSSTRELLLDTYDLECLGPFSLEEERFARAIKAFPLMKLLPEGNPHATWEMLGVELDLLQAIYLSKVLYQLFEIRAVPIPTRYWAPKVSAQEARQIAEAEHRRVRDEHPEWRLGALLPTFSTYNTSYIFQCANGKAQLEGYVPGLWQVSVDRVDGSIGTDEASKNLQAMMHGLIYGL